jgi:hypothetical protein
VLRLTCRSTEGFVVARLAPPTRWRRAGVDRVGAAFGIYVDRERCCQVWLVGCRRLAVGIGVYCQPIQQISAQIRIFWVWKLYAQYGGRKTGLEAVGTGA